MSSQAVVMSDDSWISNADLLLYKVETLLILISGLAVVGLVLLAVVSVSGRMFFDQPLAGYIDWIEQFVPLIAFSGLGYALRNGIHIRMDMVVAKLHGRTYYLMEFLATLLILLLVILLIWGSFAHFQRSFDWAQPLFSRDSSIDIGLPLWPAKLLVPFSLFMLALRSALQTIAYGSALINNPKQPVAVPLIQDVVQQAEAESSALMENG